MGFVDPQPPATWPVKIGGSFGCLARTCSEPQSSFVRRSTTPAASLRSCDTALVAHSGVTAERGQRTAGPSRSVRWAERSILGNVRNPIGVAPKRAGFVLATDDALEGVGGRRVRAVCV